MRHQLSLIGFIGLGVGSTWLYVRMSVLGRSRRFSGTHKENEISRTG